MPKKNVSPTDQGGCIDAQGGWMRFFPDLSHVSDHKLHVLTRARARFEPGTVGAHPLPQR